MKKILPSIVLFASCFTLQAQTKVEKPTALMEQRAKNFVKASHASEEIKSSVYVYYNRASKRYAGQPQQLANRLAILGFTDIYLGVMNNHLNGKDKKALQWIKDFNEAIHSHNILVHAVRLTDNGLYMYPERIEEELKTFLNYNKTVELIQRFDGLSADLEPNTLRKGGNNIPQGFTTFWDDKEYGIGSNNDILLKQSIDILQQARDSIGAGFPLSEAIGFQFQPRYDKGLLEISRDYPAMRGICTFEYEGLEKMWKSETDILPEALEK